MDNSRTVSDFIKLTARRCLSLAMWVAAAALVLLGLFWFPVSLSDGDIGNWSIRYPAFGYYSVCLGILIAISAGFTWVGWRREWPFSAGVLGTTAWCVGVLGIPLVWPAFIAWLGFWFFPAALLYVAVGCGLVALTLSK